VASPSSLETSSSKDGAQILAAKSPAEAAAVPAADKAITASIEPESPTQSTLSPPKKLLLSDKDSGHDEKADAEKSPPQLHKTSSLLDDNNMQKLQRSSSLPRKLAKLQAAAGEDEEEQLAAPVNGVAKSASELLTQKTAASASAKASTFILFSDSLHPET